MNTSAAGGRGVERDRTLSNGSGVGVGQSCVWTAERRQKLRTVQRRRHVDAINDLLSIHELYSI